MKLTVKVCIILHVGPTNAQNQDLRPLPDLFQCHEYNNGLRIGKQAFVEDRIFQGKHYYLDLREILIT